MNPQYVNQTPGGYGQGAPPAGPPGYPGPPGPGMGPPRPPQMFNNGPNQPYNRPPGPGGYMKPGPPPGPVPNGPGSAPSQGAPYTSPRLPGAPPTSQYGGLPGGPPQPNQLSNQMGSMNISGPRPGMAPNMGGHPKSMGPPPGTMGGPPNSMGAPPSSMTGPQYPMGGFPNSVGNTPNSMGGPPNSMAGQPHSMGGPPNSMAGPPNSMAGPPNSMAGPPNSMAGPPNSMAGPPNSMAGPPNVVGGPMGIPPHAGQMNSGAPPTSMGYGGAVAMGPRPPMGGPPGGITNPPTSMGQINGPASSMNGPPMTGPPMSGPPMSGPPMSGPPMSGPPMSGPPMSGQVRPPSMGGPPTGPVPPSSMAGPVVGGPPMMGPPPTSMAPPQMMRQGQMPPGPPAMGGATTAPGMPMGGQYTGGMQPPPSPGGMMVGQQPGQYPAGQSYGHQPMATQQQQPRKLDPDQMPSPIQVIEDDKRNKGGLFQTGQRGTVPPLVTTNFIAEDQGNSSPRFIRSTMYSIPCTADMLKQTQIPLAVNIAPFARLHPKEPAPPIVDLGEMGPVRCNRCKAYMCPNMLFIDGGRRFQCCFCGCATEVPAEYFNHLDHTGRRVDCYQRPELSLGTYEFVATKDYCKEAAAERLKNGKPPVPPAFIFMLDVSYNSVKSGLVHLLCSQMKDVLQRLPKETGAEHSDIRVGFVTYAKQIHFYNVKGTLAQPQMLVVSDVQDVFVPLLDGFLVTLAESEAVIDSLMEQIPQMFADSRDTEIVLGPVIQAGMDALKSAESTGKLFIFHSSLPLAEAPGKLKNRDDRKLLGSDKEKTLLTPQNSFYTNLGKECVAVGCCVDLFLFNNSYIDVATISEVSRLTGGQLYKYLYFQADLDAQRFLEDLKNNVERPIAFDAIMRIRTSTGIRPVDFLGNYYMSNTTDVELAAMDCDKSVTVEIKHDDKLSEADGAYLQAAVLYTTISGQRRLRIVNLALNCCMQMADLFRNCELDTLVNHMAKVAIRSSLNTTPKQVREALMNQCAGILACYRKNCASPSSAGQLILPECMKLLPVYTNCVIKSACLQGSAETQTDERSYLMNLVNSMTVRDTCVFFYPRLLPLHDLDLESTSVPVAIRCSYERLKENGVYLLENGLVTYMWIGMNVSPDWVQNVFGVQSVAQVDIDKTQLHDLDNALSRRVRAVVKRVREDRHRHMKLVIVRQRDKLEPVFQQYLMEDRGSNGSSSYVDFLCHIHKEIRNLLS